MNARQRRGRDNRVELRKTSHLVLALAEDHHRLPGAWEIQTPPQALKAPGEPDTTA